MQISNYYLFTILLLCSGCISVRENSNIDTSIEDPCKIVDVYFDSLSSHMSQHLCALNTMLDIDTSKEGIYFYYLPSFEKEQIVYVNIADSTIEISAPKDSSAWSIIIASQNEMDILKKGINCSKVVNIPIIRDSKKIENLATLSMLETMHSVTRKCAPPNGSQIISFDGVSYAIVIRKNNKTQFIVFSDEEYDDIRYSEISQWFKNFLFIDSNEIRKMIWK